MENVLLVVLLLLALTLIGVVLLQRSEGGGLGMGGGGGGGGVMSSRGAASALSKLTWVLGIAFLGASLALTIISAQNSADSSVTDLIAPAEETTDTGATQAPTTLPDASDLLPESDAPATDTPATDAPASDAPVAPPRAD
ncbi:preprotein translocase subunit SecG [Maritimibacter dapengensis]|uniref:Protein-export membrane protein SecG n=1 Tax=Maritimibacter dapengensis TaxID=2836868 RepID=A0ABS6SZ46_9RHOB|nr:preprotein translocase subunit SecG [Maritimibacter dapengensis]MBV7378250.1 preprotein translocase subunit SecG [Maritimibacter dapengensis]